MLFNETLLIYVIIGCGVAVAWRHYRATTLGNGWECFAAVVFWPLFLPVLLSPPQATADAAWESVPSGESTNGVPLRQVVEQTTAQLVEAMQGSGNSKAAEAAGVEVIVAELQHAWSDLAARLEAMDQAIAHDSVPWTAGMVGADPVVLAQSEKVREKNLMELRSLREHIYRALLVSVLQVRELIPLIHVARYGDSSAERLPELIAKMAAAIPIVKSAGA